MLFNIKKLKMSDTLNQMIKDYSDNTKKSNYYNNNIQQNKDYISSTNNNNSDINKKTYIKYNSPSRDYKNYENSSFLSPKKRRYFSEKTERILNDINEIKKHLNKKIESLSYYNIPNKFKSNVKNVEEENNYQYNNYNNNNYYYNKIPNSQYNFNYQPGKKFMNYSFSIENYYNQQPNKYYKPCNKLKKVKKNCPNKNRSFIELNYKNRNKTQDEFYGNNLKRIDNEFINYMNIMIGLRNKRLNQWRREFNEDNYKY